ncbi:MAG: glycosyltransferase family 4 protein [Breznakibacter sp.]
MNILFVCSAQSWGGNEKWTSMAMQALSGKHQVFFACKTAALLPKFGSYAGHIVLPFASYADMATYGKLKHFVKQHHIDLIVSTKKVEYFLCGILSRRSGIKHLIRLGVTRKMNIPFWHHLNYCTLNDGLIVNARFIEQGLRKYPFFKHHPIHVVYNGVPRLDEALLPTPRLMPSNKFVIAGSGRMTRQKGYHLLIEAIAQLPPILRDCIELKLIGDGKNKSEFEQMTKSKGLESVVNFTGYLPHPEKELSGADLYVLLSEREGISNGILEAMTLGIPVLTTNSGGIAEVMVDDENGFFTDRNVAAVKAKLEYLITNRDILAQTGINGFHTVKKHFGYSRFCRQTLDLIATLYPDR